ncbi:MAG: SDR family oxidoreductase [Chloroflexi bacterium]|nr:SDR family oxidoreductase [Chloroflexota bacterium]MBM4450338.1 SDR family oxidoreductase [Chloroflexota bacterium]MBM4453370.1 SDR family oxidoreductase [Chloroflexota bacterium]
MKHVCVKAMTIAMAASYTRSRRGDMLMRVKDKVAIVTGAAQGIGEGIATRLAEEGARIAVVDVKLDMANGVAKSLKEKGTDAIALQADTSKKPEVQAVVDEAISHFKRIDILVNNAGIHRMSKVTEITEETWDKILNINLKGYFLMVQAVAPHMQKQSYGKIVNIASVAAYGGMPDQVHYNASKGGIISLTRSLALEFAPFKINVNAVSPGAVETLGNKRFLDHYRELVEKRIPLGRIAQPADIANAVLFLVSDEAEYITGQCLSVCGGLSIGTAPGI